MKDRPADRIRGHRGRTAAVTLALCVAALPAAATLAAQDSYTLRLDGRAGESAGYRFHQAIDIRMPPEFGGRQSIRSELDLRQTVRDVRTNSIRYENRVEEVSVNIDGASSTGEGPDFSRFRGQRFTSIYDRQGRLLHLEMIGDPPAGAEQIRQSLQQVGFPILPAGPVRVGETWTATTRLDATSMGIPARGDIVSVSRGTLEEVRRMPDGEVAELRVETDFRFDPGSAAGPPMQVEMTGTRTDRVRFDVTAGRFLDGEGEQEFRLTMSIPGAAGTFTIRGTATSRTERLR